MDEEYYEEDFYDIGEEIDINVGDYVDTNIYGKQWITGFGAGGVWTSPHEEDVETGLGRGMKESSITMVQKNGLGMWYNVKWDREYGGLYVVG